MISSGADYLYTYIGVAVLSCMTLVSTLLWLPRGPVFVVAKKPLKADVAVGDECRINNLFLVLFLHLSLSVLFNQSINQLVNQSINRSMDRFINQSIHVVISINQSVNQSVSESLSQLVSQSIYMFIVQKMNILFTTRT